MLGSMRSVWSNSGAIVLETLWVMSLAVVVACFHLEVMIRWRVELDHLQERRLEYDGKSYPEWGEAGGDG